jgi:hypothetical protein
MYSELITQTGGLNGVRDTKILDPAVNMLFYKARKGAMTRVEKTGGWCRNESAKIDTGRIW